MNQSRYINEREADAAFFDDWSEWYRLDDLPERPQGFIKNLDYWKYSRAGVLPEPIKRRFWVGLAGCGGASYRTIAFIPGTYPEKSSRWESNNVYYVPAASWRRLRYVLPAIKRDAIAQASKRAIDMPWLTPL